jgi:hypothetical protein
MRVENTRRKDDIGHSQNIEELKDRKPISVLKSVKEREFGRDISNFNNKVILAFSHGK